MDNRYKPIVDEVVNRFRIQLGDRLKSAFIKGSVARGDALWGVSDLDLVLAFADPTQADSALKQRLETSINARLGQEVLIIQRIWQDRLDAYDAGTRAYWLFSCRYDVEVLYGPEPALFLPEPPRGKTLVRLIAPIVYRDGTRVVHQSVLTRSEIRLLAKRTLQALALPAIAVGQHTFIAPLKAAEHTYAAEIDQFQTIIKTAYLEAPASMNISPLRDAWRVTWQYLTGLGLIDLEGLTEEA